MKLKIPFKDDKFKCKVFHKTGDQIFIDGDEPTDQLVNVVVKRHVRVLSDVENYIKFMYRWNYKV